MMVGMDATATAGERLAAVVGGVEGDAQDIDPFVVGWIDADPAVVERARAQVIELLPCLASVLRAEDAAELGVFPWLGRGPLRGCRRAIGLHDGIDDFRVLPIDAQPAATVAVRRQALFHLLPGLATVSRPVQAGLVAELALGIAPGESIAADAVGSGVDSIRLGGIENDVDAASVLVQDQGMLPGLAAVAGLEDPAFPVGSPQMAQGSDVGGIGVLRMDSDVADVMGVAQAKVFPGLAAVGGAVDAIAPGDRVAGVGLATADPDDVGIGGSDGDIAQTLGRLGVEHRL